MIIPGHWPDSAGVFPTQHFRTVPPLALSPALSLTPCEAVSFPFPAAHKVRCFPLHTVRPFMCHADEPPAKTSGKRSGQTGTERTTQVKTGWKTVTVIMDGFARFAGEGKRCCRRIAGGGVSRLFQAILKFWMRACGS